MEASVGHDEVLSFIGKFGKARDVFLDGMCYWFAYILQGRFGGTTMYDQIEGHFVQEINGRLYDASGDVTDEYGKSAALVRWANMERFDPSLHGRILRDCVYKIERGW